jgi:NAD(P)-dependent dehydrogenase (short-subunit alcohol dehydrogenase family)
MDTNLTGKVALVTGASQGIGEAIARGLYREDTQVALIARTHAKLDQTARELGDRAFAIVADVLDAVSPFVAIKVAEKSTRSHRHRREQRSIVSSDGKLFRERIRRCTAVVEIWRVPPGQARP